MTHTPDQSPPLRRHSRRSLVAAFAATLALAVPWTATPPAVAEEAAPYFEQQVIFTQGEAGYSCFRIPAIIEAVDGSLLAFAEGRVASCDDWGDIDVVVRRSTDGGDSWGPIQVIDEGNGSTSGNPVPVVDRASGRIAVVSTHNPPGSCSGGCDRDPYLIYSEDNGASWSTPQELPDAKRPEWTGWLGTGPGHGIQLSRGEHAGRMIIGASGEFVRENGNVVKEPYLMFSDDGGLTWQIGASAPREDGTIVAGELTVAELSDGTIYVQARDGGTAGGTRSFAISNDGGETFLPAFDNGFKAEPDLVTPEVFSAVLPLRGADQDGTERLLWSAPAHPTTREVLTIRSSYDGAQTWETWNEGKVINWGPSAYSDLIQLGDDRIAVIYENGPNRPYDFLTLARMNEAYLDTENPTPPGIPPAPEPGPTTPDLSEHANTAYVRGASTVPGKIDQAMHFSGTQGIELPFTKSLDMGAGDFTFTSWFRYTETTGSRAIVWAYRMNRAPQFWLRAEPGSDQLHAHLHVGTASVGITSTQAYNDGAWHQVVLRRAGDRLTMYVDGQQVGSGAAPAGSVTSGQEFGVEGLQIGQRIDGANDFVGDLDDVRLYRRALSDAEIEALGQGRPPQPRQLALHLPLNLVEGAQQILQGR